MLSYPPMTCFRRHVCTVSVAYISELFIRSNNLAHFFLVSLFGRSSFAFRMVIAFGTPVVYLFLDLSPFSVRFAIYLGGVWKVCPPEIAQCTEVVMDICRSGKQASCPCPICSKVDERILMAMFTIGMYYPVHCWTADTPTSPCSLILMPILYSSTVKYPYRPIHHYLCTFRTTPVHFQCSQGRSHHLIQVPLSIYSDGP